MTATLLAVLEDDGLLSADDTVAALLPEVETSDGWGACTPCGERFAYSNVGYTIAGHIAETVAGKAYESLLRERVFAPLGLASAGFGPPQGDAPNQEPIGHRVLLRWFRLRMDPFETRADNSPVMAPAGAVHMTILDLARYGTAHLDGESSPSPTLLPHAAWERLHTPVRDDYARGWVRVERDWAGAVPCSGTMAAIRCGTRCSCCYPPGTRCWRSQQTRARYRRQRPRSSSSPGSWAGQRRDPDPCGAAATRHGRWRVR